MMYRKSKGISPVGGIFAYNVVLEKIDTLKCPKCNRTHMVGDLVVCEFKAVIPKRLDLKKGLDFKFTGQVFCSKHKEIKGMWATITDIIKDDPEDLDLNASPVNGLKLPPGQVI